MDSIAVPGCGRIARMHAANIGAHPRAPLAGVHDARAPSAISVADSLGATRFATSEAVFADPGMAPAADIARSGGICRAMTIHDLDLARFRSGEEVTHVTATGARLVDPALMQQHDDCDAVTVVLQTTCGRQAIITNARQAVHSDDQRVGFLGSGGMVISGNPPEDLVSRHPADATAIRAPLPDVFIQRDRAALDAEIDAFVDAVANGTPVPVGFKDGRLALALADACVLSVREGRTVAVSEIG